MSWPRRGVYFFFEPGEERSDSGAGAARVVRVGTHALKAESQSSLWGRLSQHRGSATGGYHRGSVFRSLVGLALQSRDPSLAIATWAKGSSAPAEIIEAERSLEAMVSATMAQMQVLCLPVDDEPGPNSWRGFVERNSIALLSAYKSRQSIRRQRNGSAASAPTSAFGNRDYGIQTMSTRTSTRNSSMSLRARSSMRLARVIRQALRQRST